MSSQLSKRKEYKVLAGFYTLSNLEKEVSKLLNQGWELVGGVSYDPDKQNYLQALTRTDEY